MEIVGWVLDKSAAVRFSDPSVEAQLGGLAGQLYVCQIGELEQLYSARSASEYDRVKARLDADFALVAAPADVLDRVLKLQHDLAHHHGMWHRTPISDLIIVETALHHDLGIVHVDGDFDRISEVRPLRTRRLRI